MTKTPEALSQEAAWAWMTLDQSSHEPAMKADIIFRLPGPLAREIGLVMAAHANLEHRLSILVYMLLGVPSSFGRLAVREPRAVDRFGIALELIDLHELTVDEAEIKNMREAIETVSSQRDQIAHGIWIREHESGPLHLRLTRGQWQPVQGQRGKTNRSVMPEAVTYGIEDCRSLRKLIYGLLRRIEKFGSGIERQLDASPRKFDPQHRLADQLLGRRSKGSLVRRGSSSRKSQPRSR
jgi:hypothetical protein